MAPADTPPDTPDAPSGRPVSTDAQAHGPSLGAALSGALAWWRDAGVDHAYGEAPQGWLSPPANHESGAQPPTTRPSPPAENPAATAKTPPAPPYSPQSPAQPSAPPPPVDMLGGPPAAWPTTLPAFQAWWQADSALDDPDLTGFSGQPLRVAPRGPAHPPLMIIVPQPEAGDTEHLLSGAQGRLLSAILPMLGISEAEAYIASALPRHMALPDWPTLTARGLGAILRHHIALVAPQRVIAFGANVLPLLGHTPTQNAAPFPQVTHEGFSCPLLGVGDLAMLLERPAAKARFWQRWLEFSTPGPSAQP